MGKQKIAVASTGFGREAHKCVLIPATILISGCAFFGSFCGVNFIFGKLS